MNPRSAHIDADAAALHALSALDEVSRQAVDRHVLGCEHCSRLLAEAERDVAVLAAAQPTHQPAAALPPLRLAPPRSTPQWLPVWAAAAAMLVVALIPSAYFWQQTQTMHGQMRSDANAVLRLAGSGPFHTAAFSAAAGSDAHVAYAPDGSWYVVVVRGTTRALQVAWMHDSGRTMLGTAQPHGDVAILYLPNSHRMDRLALMDGERIVSEAQLAY